MNVERLTQMKRLMEQLAEFEEIYKVFDLGDWRYTTFFGDSAKDFSNPVEALECGTSCCAVGWACVTPWFNRQGLTFDDTPVYVSEEPQSYRNWEAVTAFFEIDKPTALSLFEESNYLEEDRRDPMAVARRIDNLLEE